jgi:hypothetical protein
MVAQYVFVDFAAFSTAGLDGRQLLVYNHTVSGRSPPLPKTNSKPFMPRNGQPGDNQNSRLIAALESQPIASNGGQTLKDQYQMMINGVAGTLAGLGRPTTRRAIGSTSVKIVFRTCGSLFVASLGCRPHKSLHFGKFLRESAVWAGWTCRSIQRLPWQVQKQTISE